MLVEAGGTVIISEAAEFIGAEHIFAQRARVPEIGEQLIAVVRKAETTRSRWVSRFEGLIQPRATSRAV